MGVYEYIENVLARNITCIGTRFAGRIKTWTGIQQNYPPNGGGGGTGVVRNISGLYGTFRPPLILTCSLHSIAWKDFRLIDVFQQPVQLTQCTSFSGATGGCDTSTLQISDVPWGELSLNISTELSQSNSYPPNN
jgi:hypothetical protein